MPARKESITSFTHKQIWRSIERLAAKHELSASGLATRAGVDPTAFNISKRAAADCHQRWLEHERHTEPKRPAKNDPPISPASRIVVAVDHPAECRGLQIAGAGVMKPASSASPLKRENAGGGRLSIGKIERHGHNIGPASVKRAEIRQILHQRKATIKQDLFGL